MEPTRSLRRIVYQTEKLAQRLRFASQPADLPALLGISFPKSGTHLLDQILLGFSKVAPFSTRLHSFYAEYEGESGRKRPPEQAIAWLDSLQPGDIASAHLFARPEAVDRVCSSNVVPYFIFRDPRDVVVSHVFYVTDMEKRHVHHEYYASLPDFDSRLKASILGRPDAGMEFPDIAARFDPYLGWLNLPEVLSIQFEELIHDRPAALNRIMIHLLARMPLTARASGSAGNFTWARSARGDQKSSPSAKSAAPASSDFQRQRSGAKKSAGIRQAPAKTSPSSDCWTHALSALLRKSSA
jgi:hypothetical protein